MAHPSQPLVWIDCEMTGLDPDTDVILEIYCIITDGQLTPVTRGMGDPSLAGPAADEQDPGWGTIVHVDAARLAAMDAWCTDHHGRSGLTASVLASTVTHAEAAEGLLQYIRRFIPERRQGLLAGSSVHADKAFLRRAPYDRVMEHLHYRILDVSTLKEAVNRWAPGLSTSSASASNSNSNIAKPHKGGAHRAREDILDSIREAKYYKTLLFDSHNR